MHKIFINQSFGINLCFYGENPKVLGRRRRQQILGTIHFGPSVDRDENGCGHVDVVSVELRQEEVNKLGS